MRVLSQLASAVLLLSVLPLSASTHARHTRASANIRHSAVRKSHSAMVSMDPQRATEIQSALIKQGYLSGEPTGVWDAQSVSAMQKLQGDNGWQTKYTPDSRALIKLGLGGGSTPATAATTTGSPSDAAISSAIAPASPASLQ